MLFLVSRTGAVGWTKEHAYNESIGTNLCKFILLSLTNPFLMCTIDCNVTFLCHLIPFSFIKVFIYLREYALTYLLTSVYDATLKIEEVRGQILVYLNILHQQQII